jgi:phage terminase large subunit-like protein
MANDALDLLASLVLEDNRHWGEAAAAFQWQDARAVLNPHTETPYFFLTRARGSSKTTDLAAITTAAMLTQLPAGSRLYAIAADRDQGRLLIDAIRGFASRTEVLSDALRIDNYRVTSTLTGITLEILAADAASAFGLRPAFLIADELAQWPDTPAARQLWEAVATAMTKTPGARLVTLTSAGDPAHWSYQVREHARVDPLWYLHEVEGPPPWIDQARLDEQRRRLPVSSYRRLFWNEWTAAEDRLTDPDDIRNCITHTGDRPPKGQLRYVIGVDLGINHDRTVAAVCHLHEIRQQHDEEGDEDALPTYRVVVDRLTVWAGSRNNPVDLPTVERALLDLSRAYNDADIICDPWQAVLLAQRLRNDHVNVEEYNTSTQGVGRLASTLLSLFRTRLIALPDDPELIDELINLRIREPQPGIFRIDHDPQHHDDRAIAIALAAQQLLNNPPPRKSRVYHFELPRGPTVYETSLGGVQTYVGFSEYWGRPGY